jgi:hypothetical protein
MKRKRSVMQIELRGNADLRKALRRFAPDLEKSLKMEMKRGLAPVAKAAKGFVPSQSPLSNWAGRSFSEGTFPIFNATTIKAKIGYTTTTSKPNRQGFSTMARVFNDSRAGAIYESAGRNGPQGQPWVGPKGPAGKKFSHSRNPQAGEQFIAALPPLSGSLKGRGRLIFKAWSLDKGRAEGIVNKAITTAEQELLKRSRANSLRSAA